jgi:hypothetical protein
MKRYEYLIAALILAVGIAMGGWHVGRGIIHLRTGDRYVTVKGVSERDVTADVALWPIRSVSTDDDLRKAQMRIKESKEVILEFLKRQGIPPAAAQVQRLNVTDVLANPYRSGETRSRYIISQTLMVRSSDPTLIHKASQAIGELVDAGVVLSSTGGSNDGPTYLFTGLNQIKPEMIAEATASARQAAEQFAKDSGSRVGGIRKASQGVFEILPRDRTPGVMEWTQPNKTLRVVMTIEYCLEN